MASNFLLRIVPEPMLTDASTCSFFSRKGTVECLLVFFNGGGVVAASG
jgi:hypothetical protein